MIQVKTPFGKWRTVTREQALEFVLRGATCKQAIEQKNKSITGVTAHELLYDYYKRVKGYAENDRVNVLNETVSDFINE
jgi:hypothetical protein